MTADRPPQRPLAAFALAALAVALPAAPTFAQLIDDFEAGPFSFSCAWPGCTYIQNIGSHGIEPTRNVTLYNNSIDAQMTANLSTTVYDDAAALGFYGGLSSDVKVAYDPAGVVDLTSGGTWEYFLIRASAVSGTKVYVSVTLHNGFYAVATVDIDPSGVTLVPWSAFGVLTEQDFQAVDRFHFGFNNDTWFGWVDVTVWDIRLGRFSFGVWDGTVPGIVWCPTCPQADLPYEMSLGGGAAYTMALRPLEVMGPEPQPFLTLTGFDSGGGVGSFGPSAGSAVYYSSRSSYNTSTFKLLVEYTAGPGYAMDHPPDPAIVLNDGASIEVRSVIGLDDGGRLPPNVLESFRLDLDPTQPLLLEQAAVTSVSPGPGVDAAYEISFQLTADGTADLALPLFTTMMTGDWAPAGTPTDAPVAAASPTSALSARPSITTGPTRLVLARPAQARADITLFDVTGRLVRRLGVDAGSGAVEWDGRGDGGRNLSPGVYFAHLSSAAAAPAARITVVR
jgi:hypothetical protein